MSSNNQQFKKKGRAGGLVEKLLRFKGSLKRLSKLILKG